MEVKSLDIEQTENYLASYLSGSLLNKQSPPSAKDFKKLSKLTQQQLLELAADAVDEINRRSHEGNYC